MGIKTPIENNRGLRIKGKKGAVAAGLRLTGQCVGCVKNSSRALQAYVNEPNSLLEQAFDTLCFSGYVRKAARHGGNPMFPCGLLDQWTLEPPSNDDCTLS